MNVRPFRQRLPWIGGDLQTIRNTVLDALGRGPRGPDSLLTERIRFPMQDDSGDVLLALLDRPPEPSGKPLAVLIHGITGCEDSAYMRSTAAHLIALGYPVLRLNLRGSGPSQGLCHQMYHAGRSEDFRRVAERLAPDWDHHGMVAIGYSLGANMLLKYLGEEGEAAPFRAAVAISAPIDLASTAYRMLEPRNALYHGRLLAWLRRESLAAGGSLTASERRAVRAARSVYAFDDTFVAPRNGFGTADTYYAVNSAARFLADIRVPTLVIHAGDDPWIPIAAYQAVAWTHLPFVTPLISDKGGHVGFHGAEGPPAWHDCCLSNYFSDVL